MQICIEKCVDRRGLGVLIEEHEPIVKGLQ